MDEWMDESHCLVKVTTDLCYYGDMPQQPREPGESSALEGMTGRLTEPVELKVRPQTPVQAGPVLFSFS